MIEPINTFITFTLIRGTASMGRYFSCDVAQNKMQATHAISCHLHNNIAFTNIAIQTKK